MPNKINELAPVLVKPYAFAPSDTTPDKVKLVPLTLMALPAPNTTLPDSALAPEVLLKVPSKLRFSAPKFTPCRSNTAPLLTAVEPAVVPKAEALLAATVPALICNTPLKVLLPDKAKVPSPVLVNP